MNAFKVQSVNDISAHVNQWRVKWGSMLSNDHISKQATYKANIKQVCGSSIIEKVPIASMKRSLENAQTAQKLSISTKLFQMFSCPGLWTSCQRRRIAGETLMSRFVNSMPASSNCGRNIIQNKQSHINAKNNTKSCKFAQRYSPSEIESSQHGFCCGQAFFGHLPFGRPIHLAAQLRWQDHNPNWNRRH